MSQKIATLYAEVDADLTKFERNLTSAKSKLREFGKATGAITDTGKESQKASKNVGVMASAFTYLKKIAVAFVAIRLAKEIKDIGVDAVRVASQVETLGVVVDQLGKNAGYTSNDMRSLEKSVSDNGITLQATRLALSRMMQAQIDLSKATELSRMAQDTAVVSLENSSDSFVRLINVISSGNVRMARNMGIMVSFAQAYKQYADENDRAVESLTEMEKIQIRTNAILKQGVQLTGAYEAAMETAGKKALSSARYWEELKRAYGDQTLGPYAKLVDMWNDILQTTEKNVRMREALRVASQNNIITDSELASVQQQVAHGLMSTAEVMEWLTNKTAKATDVIWQLKQQLAEERATEAWSPIDEEAIANMEEAVTLTQGYLDILDRDVGSPMGNFVKDLEWFIATGGQYETTFGAIKQALMDEKITPEQAKSWTEELILSFYDAKEEIGQINLGEAGNKVAEDTSYWWGQAVDHISGTGGVGEAMQTVDDIASQLTGLPGMAGIIQQMGLDLDTLTKGRYHIDVVMDILQRYTGTRTTGISTSTSATGQWGLDMGKGDRPDFGGENPYKASGGMLASNTWQMVGEQGFELVANGRVYSHSDSMKLMKMGVRPGQRLGTGGFIPYGWGGISGFGRGHAGAMHMGDGQGYEEEGWAYNDGGYLPTKSKKYKKGSSSSSSSSISNVAKSIERNVADTVVATISTAVAGISVRSNTQALEVANAIARNVREQMNKDNRQIISSLERLIQTNQKIIKGTDLEMGMMSVVERMVG